MSLVGNDEPSKPRVILYFAQDNGDVAKNFATRMRTADKVDVTLVWSSAFRDETSVLGGVGAIVLEVGCRGVDRIAELYNQYSPDTEIHYMNRDGSWLKDDEGNIAEGVEPSKEVDADPADVPGALDLDPKTTAALEALAKQEAEKQQEADDADEDKTDVEQSAVQTETSAGDTPGGDGTAVVPEGTDGPVPVATDDDVNGSEPAADVSTEGTAREEEQPQSD